MFGKKKNSINKVVVSSKEELKTAIKRKEPYIEVQGDLAKKMKWMGKLSSVKIAAIIALLTSTKMKLHACCHLPLVQTHPHFQSHQTVLPL